MDIELTISWPKYHVLLVSGIVSHRQAKLKPGRGGGDEIECLILGFTGQSTMSE